MNLLIDTHAAIWALRVPQRIPKAIQRLIADPDNAVHVSVVSIWEIAIKRALGRGNLPPFSAADAIRHFAEAGYATLGITDYHAAAVEDLPLLHGDPFDRLLVAQALSEPMRLVTHDNKLAAYSQTIITW